jgi:hypothetical protein
VDFLDPPFLPDGIFGSAFCVILEELKNGFLFFKSPGVDVSSFKLGSFLFMGESFNVLLCGRGVDGRLISDGSEGITTGGNASSSSRK